MQKISSLNNKLVVETKLLHQKKYRDKSNLFLAEGEKILQEALNDHLIVKGIFSSSEDICKKYSAQNAVLVTEQIIKKLSTTDSPPEVISVIEKPVYRQISYNKPLILLDGIQDPGNLGTIIRTASAFDAGAILLTGDTVDVYNPKVVRSTVGNLWKTPIIKVEQEQLKKQFPKHTLAGTTLDKTKNPKAFYDIKTVDNLIVMFGSEANGLSKDIISQADIFINIPMTENVESLNLSVSAGIIMQYLYMKKSS